MAIPIPPFKLD